MLQYHAMSLEDCWISNEQPLQRSKVPRAIAFWRHTVSALRLDLIRKETSLQRTSTWWVARLVKRLRDSGTSTARCCNNCLKNTCGAAASYAPCMLQWFLWYVPEPVSFLGLERKRATSGILCFNLWWHRSAAKVGACPNVLEKIIPRHSRSVRFVRTPWRIGCSWVAGVHLSQSALWSGTARIWFPYWNLRLSLVRVCMFAPDSLTWAVCFCPAPLADSIAYHIIDHYCILPFGETSTLKR